MQQKICECSSVENNSLRWFSSSWWILSLVKHEKRFVLLVTQTARKKKSESNWLLVDHLLVSVLTSHWLDSCCENSDFLFRATCVIIKTSQNNSSALKEKIPVQTDPIRSGVQSDTQSDPIQILLTAFFVTTELVNNRANWVREIFEKFVSYLNKVW